MKTKVGTQYDGECWLFYLVVDVGVEVVDVGDYDTVIGRNFLAESAFRLTNRPIEATVLTGMLGVYEVMPIDKFLCVGKDDKVMLLKNTEIKYRG